LKLKKEFEESLKKQIKIGKSPLKINENKEKKLKIFFEKIGFFY